MASCAICFSEVQASSLGCTPTCAPCLKTHVVTSIGDRKLPICLCQKGIVHSDIVHNMLKDDTVKSKVFDILCIERTIPIAQRLYCPNPVCGFPLVKGDGVVICDKCSTNICSSCATKHDDNHQCTKDDESLKEISDAGYKQCKCGFFVERVMACNKVVCRCSNVFCYKCGNEYVNGRSNCTCPLYDEELRFYVSSCNLLEKMKLLPYNNERFKRTLKKFEEMIVSYAGRMSDVRAKSWLTEQQKEICSLGRQLISLEAFYHVNKKCDKNLAGYTDYMENYQTIVDDMRNGVETVQRLQAQVAELNRTVAAYREVGKKRQRLMHMVANLPDNSIMDAEVMRFVVAKKS